MNPKVVILSGGPNSVHVEGSPRVPDGFFEYCKENSIPVLGICYGMQMITHLLGGEVKSAVHGGEYGRMPMDIAPASQLFSFLSSTTVNVWMSHGDEAVKLPEGFVAVAKSHQVRLGPGRRRRREERREVAGVGMVAGGRTAVAMPRAAARMASGMAHHSGSTTMSTAG